MNIIPLKLAKLVIASGAVMVLAIVIWFKYLLQDPPTAPTAKANRLISVAQISKIIPLRFPRTAIIVDGSYFTGPSHYIIAKVQMPANSLQNFIAQPLIIGKTSREVSELNEHKYPDIQSRGWRIDSIKKFISVNQVAVDKGNGQIGTLNMKIDLTHSKFVILYLYYIN